MNTRRDNLVRYNAKLPGHFMSYEIPKVRGALLDFEIERADVTIIVEMLTNYKEDLREALFSNSDEKVRIFRNKFVSNTQWKERTVDSIISDLYFMINGVDCSIESNIPTEDCGEEQIDVPSKGRLMIDPKPSTGINYCSICGVKTKCFKAIGGFICNDCVPDKYRSNPAMCPVREYRDLR